MSARTTWAWAATSTAASAFHPKAWLRLAVAGGGVGLWEWEVATSQLIWNGQLKAIFGLPGEDDAAAEASVALARHPRRPGGPGERL